VMLAGNGGWSEDGTTDEEDACRFVVARIRTKEHHTGGDGGCAVEEQKVEMGFLSCWPTILNDHCGVAGESKKTGEGDEELANRRMNQKEDKGSLVDSRQGRSENLTFLRLVVYNKIGLGFGGF
jgi:hypothetical protein